MAVKQSVISHIFQKVALTAIGWTLSVSVMAAYVATELPGLGVKGSSPYGVDNSGAVTGLSTTIDNKTRSFLWKNGKITDLGNITYQGSVQSWGKKSNPAGQVTGTVSGGSYPGAYLYSDGVMKLITGGYGNGINAAGDVVGSSNSGSAFLYKDGLLTDLGTFARSTATAQAINNAGTIVGHSADTSGNTRGFIWKNGGVTLIPPMAGNLTVAMDINDAGDVVGLTSIAADPNTWHVFIWKNGVMTDTGISAPRTIPANGYSINNAGHVLTPGGVLINNVFTPVAAMLPPEWAQGYRPESNTFWYFPALTGMNDAGQLTGATKVQDMTTGLLIKVVGFLLTPGTMCNK